MISTLPQPELVAMHRLEWDADNAGFVCDVLLPQLGITGDVEKVICWAYGRDGGWPSYERISDGSSLVADLFLGGKIKEPFGVGHDFLYELNRLCMADPSGRQWTKLEADAWYRRAAAAFGFRWRARVRWIGLQLGGWRAWYGAPQSDTDWQHGVADAATARRAELDRQLGLTVETKETGEPR